jgi:hypothetical protein
MRLIGFNDRITMLEPGQRLPEPAGGTLMNLAFDHIRQMSPRRVIVISDGEPADANATLASARALNCVISTFYCGEAQSSPHFADFGAGVRKESAKAKTLWNRILAVVAGFVCCFLAERDSPA